ncbi:MAG: dihydrodipicolinate synthase family protein [Nitrososphaerota archaeon]|nr:dihydrodipicolinate synthase family protein [Nitrososphaerota archaeon]MDG7020019.1 dihydrodipicolinate synthase family protein [Nitrososphaerota archaeon]MDG7027208.1 dihydrodipicolinate synthase family protein [Nitrososphaerota archaeon]
MPQRAPKVKGLFTALLTPFDGEGRADAGTAADLVRFQVSKGADGIYVCGSTGLGPMLGVDERKAITEAAVGASGKVPVVVQVGCADTRSTVLLAKHAERAGAYAVASLTPYYYRPGELAVAKHFEAVSKAVTLPLLAYNIPQFTGNNLLPETVAALADAGTIAGVKDSCRDLLQLLDLIDSVPEGFVVMNGAEEYGLFAMMSGADGLVSGGANALPELMKSMVAAEMKGAHQGAIEAQARIMGFKALVRASPIPSYYAILRARGLDCGSPRRPFLGLRRAESDRLISTLRRLGFLSPSG